MPRPLFDRLDEWKRRFGAGDAGALESLLELVARRRFRDAPSLIRLHETLLFLRAYPASPRVAEIADRILFSFADRVRGCDLTPFEEPEISGIAGTALAAVFTYEVAERLAARHGADIEIAWDRMDDPDALGPVLRRMVPLLGEDWPVEAHAPYREWIEASRGQRGSDLGWILRALARLPVSARERAERYDQMRLPLLWNMSDSAASRSRMRLRRRKLFCHTEPLVRRSEASLESELAGPPLGIRRLSRSEAHRILELIVDTSAMRYRELYGFSHPDESGVFHCDLGRAVDFYFFGVPREWRLPLRAYHAGMYFKNGVPAGYVELLSICERAEVGFNLYYTFREGESAWLYARLLHLFQQVLGVTCFSVDPYQIGLENEEAIDSGAFWFYRKMGFRPVRPKALALVEREEQRMRESAGYRSSGATLRRLAVGPVMFGGDGTWDRFQVRNIGMALGRAVATRYGGDPERMKRAAAAQARRTLGIESDGSLAQTLLLVDDLARWSGEEKAGVAAVIRAKEGAGEDRYLKLMQRHGRLRAALAGLGSS